MKCKFRIIFYMIFKRKVFIRYKNLKKKYNKRLECVKKALQYINKWDGIPLSWQIDSISDILCLPDNYKISKHFCITLIISDRPIEEIAKGIPLKFY